MIALLAALAAAQTPIPLQTMGLADGERTRTLGTGCTWSDGRPRAWRMAMTDDRAAVKRGGRYVIMRPAPGARHLFPFTYDRWSGGGMTILVRETGRSRKMGTEAFETPGSLSITERGVTRTWRGRLSCGS
jgi:hypothetical protein